ncbi:hypothetical protein [Bradyrhizobium viridifuturi]|uniref:hypothetical protein n=1 Tax=Bradyrhizobium viridifuturi TaxID=1654716 RepID=UPI000AAEA99E|nr:hypothetical protein [Bradyrhizobium viridifuturi]
MTIIRRAPVKDRVIEPWLELLPFSTRPEAIFEGLVKAKAFYGRDWQSGGSVC